MKLIPFSDCSGCGACMNICPSSAIRMRENEEGFLFPEIKKEKCTDCGTCIKVCPVINLPRVDERIQQVAYVAINQDIEELKHSASGGMFRLMSGQWTGSVYGAYMGQDFSVYLKEAISENDLSAMQGSKYVFSHTGHVYADIKKKLDKGEKVLFFGLPCQVAALRNYCGVNDGLLCVDIVCHGVPSESLFHDYIKTLERQYGKVRQILFTAKIRKWNPLVEKNLRVVTESGEFTRDFTQDPYMWWFVNCLSYRESCYHCKFATIKRIGDITIGDFFGLGIIKPYKGDTSYGVSQVLINTKKGAAFFNSLDCITKEERSIEECMTGNANLYKASLEPKARKEFYHDYAQHGFSYICKKYYDAPARKISVKIKYILRRIMPRFACRLLLFQRRHEKSSPEIRSYTTHS